MQDFFIGKKYGKWTVVSFSHRDKYSQKLYTCECECGTKKVLPIHSLVNGHNTQCRKCAHTKHGLCHTRIYKIYKNIIQRCENPRRDHYKNYGGRGIKICEEWRNNPLSFYKWAVSNGYQDWLTIDRIDVNGDYCPENCRWVDRKTQANNKRTNKCIFYKSERYTIAEFAEKFNINKNTIQCRLKNKPDNIENLISPPKIGKPRVGLTINGETKSIIEWCKIYNKKKTTVINRIKLYGYSPLEALTKPLKKASHSLTEQE